MVTKAESQIKKIEEAHDKYRDKIKWEMLFTAVINGGVILLSFADNPKIEDSIIYNAGKAIALIWDVCLYARASESPEFNNRAHPFE